MKATEIADAVQALIEAPFVPDDFPYDFLRAFGADDVTIKRLRAGNSNRSDVDGAVLPGGKTKLKVHIVTAKPGEVDLAMDRLRRSAATEKQKARFLLTTDGQMLQAIDLEGGADDVLACTYAEFADRFGFFFPMAGISLTAEIRDNPIDIKATGRLDKLYVELLRDERNRDWADEPGRARFNHFMAQLIFCFYAEDTLIFYCPGVELMGERPKGWAGYFTETIRERTRSDASDMKMILEIIFGTMSLDTRDDSRTKADVPLWADRFPYVNGQMFTGEHQVPHVSRMARTYLIRAGELNWTDINPDIFGSMIQAVADDDERGSLGMHYTSVPNILKVLNPLFLDDLEAQLGKAGKNRQQLGKLKKRLSGIRIFDPACGSGNFLVIAYKMMREIEHKANLAAGWGPMPSIIPTRNFRGIEIKSFSAEVARLALIIAEYQCNAIYLDQTQADNLFLPLDRDNWITCGNALRLDWLELCPPPGQTQVRLTGDDLFGTPPEQAEIDFENEGGEVFICGNPPYVGYNKQTPEQKSDLKSLFYDITNRWKSLDYVSGWFIKTARLLDTYNQAGLVATNSVNQGEHATILWPLIFDYNVSISFGVSSFLWSNNAAKNAGVTVSIVGLRTRSDLSGTLFIETEKATVPSINQYLLPGKPVAFDSSSRPLFNKAEMLLGNMPKDGGNLIMTRNEAREAMEVDDRVECFVRPFFGSREFINGSSRCCLWIEDKNVECASEIPFVANRLLGVRKMRLESKAKSTQKFADRPHKFKQIQGVAESHTIIAPSVSSERREYLPVGLLPQGSIVSSLAFALYDAPLWNMALIASKLHLVWIATVCGKLKTDYRYSNTLGWNTFPVPTLTERDRAELTRAAENILLAREGYFPATIANIYDPKRMDTEFPALRAAHEQNDYILEDIYIGRRFRNDTERLEKLFEMYMDMTERVGAT